MSTVTATIPSTIRTIALTGCVAFWTARRVLRQAVINALKSVNYETVPPVDHYDALAETGMAIVRAANLSRRRSPVRPESLSRTGVGCEFYQTFKGEKQNSREFLFSLGVDAQNKAFLIHQGVNPALTKFFADPNAESVLNGMYQSNLQYMPSRDVTDALVGLIRTNRSVRLKDTGGVYFVPECGIATVDAVFTALNNAGCRCTMLKHDLSDNDELCKQVLESTNEQLMGDLETMQDEIRDILDNDKKPRINGIKSKMKSLAQHADLLEYYQRMFGDNMALAQQNLSTTFELLAELQLRYKGE